MECPICYEVIQSTNACVTPCGHSFCFNCVIHSLQNADTCPCCRALLVTSSSEDHDEDEELDSDQEFSGSEEDEEEEEEEEEDTRTNIDVVTNAFVTRGYDVKDALSMLLCSYSKTDPKYTRAFIAKLNDDFDEIMEEIETQQREQTDFAAEDVNVLPVSAADKDDPTPMIFNDVVDATSEEFRNYMDFYLNAISRGQTK